MRARRVRRVALLACLAAFLVSPLTSPADAAKSARVPLPSVRLPAALDWQPEYQGQWLCSEWAKPGAVKLSNLLRRTYGSYTTYISRSCATPGISEHEEGRAIDWMVDVERRETRQKARSFLNWLTAPGPNGEPGAMARRLGIMYLIYDDRMWRAYRPEDGWREYNGCFSQQSEGMDTSCHRDHIHISLTWDGAYAKTSFWTGRAESRPPCASSAVRRPNGSTAQPRTLINTDSGLGVKGKNCRLAAGTSYTSRSYSIRVPVPRTADGSRPVQRVQLAAFDLNAPVGVTIRSAGRITIPQGTRPGGVFEIPLASDGVIRISVGAGYSQLWLRGLGAGAPDTRPAAVGMARMRPNWLVNLPFPVAGRLVNPPMGAQLRLARRMPGGKFRKVASAPAVSGPFELTAPAVTVPGVYSYRAVLRHSGRAIARSRIRTMRVGPPVATLNQPAVATAGQRAVFTGGVLGAPAGARLEIRVKVPRQRWTTRGSRVVGNGGFTVRKKFAKARRYYVRVRLVTDDRVWARSPKRILTVAAPKPAPAPKRKGK